MTSTAANIKEAIMTSEQKNFIERVGKLATADMQSSGILASLTIAQAILESRWGKSGLTVGANALFGIKATSAWKGKVYNCKTKECYDGKNCTVVDGCFRAYSSWEDSIKDHSAFLTGLSRYSAVVGETDYKKACKAIHAAGYATDPNYANKLINIIEQYGLTAYDKVSTASASSAVTSPAKIGAGDLVEITGVKYYNSVVIPTWVKKKRWIVHSANGDRVVIDKSEDGKHNIMSPINSADLKLIKKS